MAASYIQSNVIEIKEGNIDTFIKESISIPKIFLFTEKKGIPLIYKSLSLSFEV